MNFINKFFKNFTSMSKNKHNIIIFIVVIVLLVLNSPKISESFQIHLAQPTKSVDGERQFPDDLKWMSQPSKCFSCERELVNRYGNSAGFNAQPSKCFSCEREMGMKKLF
jgi:hypothetical protein